jgi:alanyl-tRNA synthetase
VHERERWLNDSAALLRTPPEELEPRVRKLLDRDLALEKEVAQLNRKVVMAAQGAAEAPYEISDLRGCTKLAVGYLPDGGMDQVRSLADLLRDKIGDGVVLVGGAAGGKLVFVVAATRSLSSVHAGRIVSQLAPLSGSRGGGKPDFGQAGGGDPAAWDKIKERFEALVLDAFAGK